MQLSIEWRSGYFFDSNTVIRPLTQADWLERKQKLDVLGGPRDVRGREDLSAAEQNEIAANNITP